MRAWINGRLLDSPETPAVSVLDHGLIVGDGVFETAQIIDGRAFALTRHLNRLVHSARGLGLGDLDLGLVRAGVDAVLGDEPIASGRLRITVTSGPGPMGSPRGPGPLTHTVVAEPADPMPPTTAVATSSWPRNERGILAGLKTTSYAENAALVEQARARGASETIVPNIAGNVCEGTGANIFYEHAGRLVTPPLAAGCLAGVTRALVLEWCRGEVDIVEQDGPMSRLITAREMFLASSTRNVQAIHRLDERSLQAPGPLTARVVQIFTARMADDIDPR